RGDRRRRRGDDGGRPVRAPRAARAARGAGGAAEHLGNAPPVALLEHLGRLRLRAALAGRLPPPPRPLLSDRPQVAPGLAVGITAVAALLGRVVLGFVIDRFEPRRAAAVCFLVQVAAIAALARADLPLVVYAACALYGFSVGNN